MRYEARRESAAPAAAGLLLGISLARESLIGARWLPPLALLLIALGLIRRGSNPRVAAIMFLVAACSIGFWHGARDSDARSRRTAWLPEPGVAIERHFVGLVQGAVEPGSEGERLLRARLVPEGRTESDSWVNVRLRIEPSDGAAMQVVDAFATGDRIRVWARVRVPRSPGNPGGRDFAEQLRAQGVEATGTVGSVHFIDRIERGRWGARRAADRVRQWARSRLDRMLNLDGSARPLLGAMLLGDRALLGQEWQRVLRRSGTAHLASISGLHVGMLLGVIHTLTSRFGKRGWGRFSISCVVLSGFALAVGSRVSVWRAVLGAGIWLGGRSLGREGSPMHNLLLVAAALAWFRPESASGAGFQLTLLAVAGILLYAEPIQRALPLPAPIGIAPAVTLSAALATAPVVAWHFGWLAPVGVLANLAAVPLCAASLLSALAAVLCADLPWVGFGVATACEASAAGLGWVAETASSWDAGSIAVARPSTWVLCVHYGLLAGARLPWPRPVVRQTLGGLLALSIAWVHLGAPPPRASGITEARVLDVGQGLSVALFGPTGGTLLFDAGGGAAGRFDPGERVVAPFLLERGVRRVDLLVLSHGDVDHAGGAMALFEALEVGELWLGPHGRRSPLIRHVAEEARSRGVAIRLAEAGATSHLFGIPLRVLGPDRRWSGPGTNDGSVVLVAGEAPSRLLLPGDLGSRGERELLASGQALRAEALIVGHHGSRNGTANAFLRAVRPDRAIVSAGFRNPFGHPHPALVERVRRANARLLRTDLHGAVRLLSTPRGWSVDSYRPERIQNVRTPAAARR
jgi:competence protein ComEC